MLNRLRLGWKELPIVCNRIHFYDYLVFFPMAIYFLLASFKISQPGLYYDEIFFANAAKGIIDPNPYGFVFLKIGNVPLFLMSYIGALKAYFYYPIFLIFGVSPLTIRLPVIVVSTLAIYFFYKAISLYFNKPIALVSVAMLATDPSFLSVTRFDLGPNVPEFFIKALCMYFFILYLKVRKNKYLFFIFFSMAAGIFNKLHFIWFINSFFLAALVVYWQEWKSIISIHGPKPKYIFVLMIILAYIALSGYFFSITRFFNSDRVLIIGMNFNDFFLKLIDFYDTMKAVLIGQYFYNWIFGYLSLQSLNYFWILVSGLILGGLIISIITTLVKKDIFEKNYWFFVLLFALTLGQLALSKDALKGWHMFSIYPFTFVLLSYYIYRLWEVIPLSFIRRLVPIGIITIILSYNLFIYTKYINAYDHPHNPYYSNAIYDLVEYTKKSKGTFVSVDWGTHAQLLAFHDGVPGKYVEIVYLLNNLYETNLSDEHRNLLIKYLDPSNNYFFIMHPVDKTVFIKARQYFFNAASKYNVKLNLFQEITDSKGRVIYEIYNVKKQSDNV